MLSLNINETPIVKKIAAPITGHGVIASIPSSLFHTIARNAKDIKIEKLFLSIHPLISHAIHNIDTIICPVITSPI